MIGSNKYKIKDGIVSYLNSIYSKKAFDYIIMSNKNHSIIIANWNGFNCNDDPLYIEGKKRIQLDGLGSVIQGNGSYKKFVEVYESFVNKYRNFEYNIGFELTYIENGVSKIDENFKKHIKKHYGLSLFSSNDIELINDMLIELCEKDGLIKEVKTLDFGFLKATKYLLMEEKFKNGNMFVTAYKNRKENFLVKHIYPIIAILLNIFGLYWIIFLQ